MLRLTLLPAILILSVSITFLQGNGVDGVWKEIQRTVEEGDFEGYAALYHEDAILVNGISGQSYPIAQALSGWEQGFIDTKSGKIEAKVDFRFSECIRSETTAHDTGIFKYSSKEKDGDWQDALIHFQSLFIKIEGEWKMMMEYQISVATEEEWDLLK